MRTLDALRNTLTGKIYIYCKDKTTAKEFLAAAEKEGYRFGTFKPTDNKPDDFIALEDNKQLSYVGLVGRIAVQCSGSGNANLHIIDFAKYKGGEEDYYFKPEKKC